MRIFAAGTSTKTSPLAEGRVPTRGQVDRSANRIHRLKRDGETRLGRPGVRRP
jgi:hypothetical protein